MTVLRVFAAILSLACAVRASDAAAEQKALDQILLESGASPIELMRGLEKFLAKYPDSKQRAGIERELAKTALENGDDERTLRYGGQALASNPRNPVLLERMARLLLARGKREDAEKALEHSRQFESLMRELDKQGIERPRPGMADELDRAIARSLSYQARATRLLGRREEAIELARRAAAQHANAESLRELAAALDAAGRAREALTAYADAFAAADPKNPETSRAKDRARAGELHRAVHGSEKGLGELLLAAYDRMASEQTARLAKLRARDPNFDADEPGEWTIRRLDGESFPLAGLAGKVVVLDFWATWCGPCRAQHPLFDQVREKFAGNDKVVILSINTDEDRSVVAPFLETYKWSNTVYFEDGLSSFLKINSIPTTVILDKRGRVFSRMVGFIPDRFAAMLTERIHEALAEK